MGKGGKAKGKGKADGKGGKGKGKVKGGKGKKGGGKGGKGGKGGGKKGGAAKVVIEPHRHEGAFVSKGKDDSLVTRNLVPGESVYGEKRLVAESADGEDKIEYRVWNPFRSKLGAGIVGGIGSCPVKPGAKVLYLGGASGTTVSHVSDMVGPEGVVYAVEFSHRSGRDLTNMAKRRPNVVPIVEDARQPQRYRMLIGMVDVIFSDVAQPDQARIVTHNAGFFLKNNGWVMISIKANCVDSTAAPEAVFASEIDKLRKDGVKPKEQLTLEPYHRDHALVVGIYRASKKKKRGVRSVGRPQLVLFWFLTMSGVMAMPSLVVQSATPLQSRVAAPAVLAPSAPAPASGLSSFSGIAVAATAAAAAGVAGAVRRSKRSTLAKGVKVSAVKNHRSLRDAKVVVCAGVNFPEGRKLRVAVVGGGPAGASAADQLAKDGVETYLIERKMDNCKPCGGAIPLCMIDEFDLPKNIVDRQVRKMTMISPTNKEVQIGQTLKDDEYIGMVRREVLDDFLRQRAKKNGATLINGLFLGMTLPEKKGDSYVLTYNDYEDEQGNARKGVKKSLEVDVVIGADGANSRVAKDIEAGDYEYAIAFQERMKIPEQKMDYYKDRAEMYVGEDVSPDFYAWVFPKCDHVAVGTGTVVDKKGIQRYQQGIRDRAATRIDGGEIIRVEAHPIPEHPRPWRVKDRAILVGDAAGYVTKCSGEGIYFAAKSGRMCAETIVKNSKQGVRMIDEADLMEHLREWDGKYGPTYLVLDLLQKVFYTSDAARESFVELCEEEYVQKVTFDSYLYKTVQGNDPMGDLKLGWKTLSSLYKFNNQKTPDPMRTLA